MLPPYIATNQVIYKANRLTGFYMERTLGVNRLTHSPSHKLFSTKASWFHISSEQLVMS